MTVVAQTPAGALDSKLKWNIMRTSDEVEPFIHDVSCQSREIGSLRQRANEADVADYILDCHDGDAKSAIKAMQDEIEHLQHQLNLAVIAMGRGNTDAGVWSKRNGGR
ncbi:MULTISPECIES: hypothetical protein [unclassified Rhizobium]|uniref:hypothetical protein n=1 Tax=unclassified Rhizobium TaxID=2613769 RepID=UPI002889C623|nr:MULTISPECIES: hypothetical protein [unclassified Rhizobium]